MCVSLSVGLIYFFLFISPKSGPSEARLEIEEETSEQRVGSENGEGEDQTDAATHQAGVSKEEESVLEKEIIDVSYLPCNLLGNSKSDYCHAMY